jgi:hypothetical protein
MITRFLTISTALATANWDRGSARKHVLKVLTAQERIVTDEVAANALSFLGAGTTPRICVKRLISGLTLASLGLLAPIGTQAATISAASPSSQDVSAAVARANNGDTVQVPAGTATWTSGITISKNIYLIGAGSSQTIITAQADSIITWKPVIDDKFRLSGFRFNGLGFKNIIHIIGPATQARIDHCIFYQGDSGVTTNYIGSGATGRVAGVVDHCSFYNMARAAFVCDIRATDTTSWGSTAWNEGAHPGTVNMLYWEDNQFIYDANLTGNADATFYGQYGGSAVIRHNTFSGFAYCYLDAHGDGPDYSTLIYEIYSNTFTQGTNGVNAGWFMNQRGGKRIMWDNTFSGRNSGCELIKYWPDDVHIVSDSYFWGNTWNGDKNQADLISVEGPNSSTIVLGKNYFLAAPRSGQTFYPYNPLVYPHPLVTGDATHPSRPASLRVVP